MMRLGYWNIRGLAQPIRFVLEYSAITWEDVLYKQAGPDAPVPFDKSCWFGVKQHLNLSFPNLPYLEDTRSGIKLSQSQAILRYVCKQSPHLRLLGWDLESETAVDMILAEYSDCKGRMTGIQYQHGIEGAGANFIVGAAETDLPATLQRFSLFLGTKPWFAGDHLTVADFVMFEYLACASLFHGAYMKASSNLDHQPCLVAYPNLMTLFTKVENLPAIANYLASDRFAEVRAMNNQHARFR